LDMAGWREAMVCPPAEGLPHCGMTGGLII
jgi:hypothetical protein